MKTLSTLLLFFLFGVSGICQDETLLNFVESSSGMNNPQWESGKTELEFADINMDGYVDILSIGDHGSPFINAGEHGIMVWFGDGTGSWSVQMTGDFGYGGIAVGDVNNDGHWDVGYGMHHDYSSNDLGDQLLEVALGDGSGTSWTPWDDGLATNGENWGLFGTDFADVDNDGDLDIGSNSFGSGSGLHVYINNGDGTWTQSFGIMPGNSNLRFVFGDMNNDGNADFVVTHDAGIAFFGTGDGDFYNADYNLPQYSYPMSGPDLKDVNKDGADDLAYVNTQGGIDVWTFDPEAVEWIDISGSLPASGDYQEAQLCDFNSDGTMDIAAFGDANLTVWRGSLSAGNISWTEVFHTVTSNNGDCAAFRAGGDVDRNGYPDMTFVEKQGSWPSDQNHLKCYKNAAPYLGPNIKAVYPRGREKFKQQSVQFTDWISAVPVSSAATVQIEYSLQGAFGPFHLLTQATPNSGRFQWIVPQTTSTNNCFFRYTLVQGDDTLQELTPVAFTILGDPGLAADFTADTTVVQTNAPVQFIDQSLGLLNEWEWDFDNDGSIDATQRNPMHAYAEPGFYTVSLNVSDGTNQQNLTKTDFIEVIAPLGIEDQNEDAYSLTIYPNPVKGRQSLWVEAKWLKGGNAVLEIVSLDGQLIFNDIIDVETARFKLPAMDLSPGIYLLKLGAAGKIYSEKILVF